MDALPERVTSIHSSDVITRFLLENGEVWALIGPSNYDSGYDEGDPKPMYFGGVESISGFGSRSVALREGGSVWYSPWIGTHAYEIVRGWDSVPNTGPVANAGPDIVLIKEPDDGNPYAVVDAWRSTDDCQIRRWGWQRQGGITGYPYPKTRKVESFTDLAPGRNRVVLTVWDDQGLSSTDEIELVVFERAEFENWLAGYFTPEEIELFGDQPENADPDLDGYTNGEEMGMETNPRELSIDYLSSRFQLVMDKGRLAIEVGPYALPLNYTLYESGDSLNWTEMEYESYVRDGKMYLLIPGNESSLYQVKVAP